MLDLTRSLKNREQLQVSTRCPHIQLEAEVWPAGGFSGKAHYVRLLEALRSAHLEVGLRAALGRADRQAADHEYAALRCLDQDLGPTSRSAGKRPLSEAEAWGVSYVLIGSTAGAKTILNSESMKPEWPQAYLEYQRDFARSGGLRRFFDALDAATIDLARTKAAAIHLFERLQTMMIEKTDDK
ncbi:hypothetical protein [Thalassococcus sp. S3]|uniref:hypothetical protein n=1 Tax=Thalassococcus sp. S3 TaxID=2017482 RepID=UPI0010242C9A|nr:hypothetical protein [Thalassococcus sp. S3]QBF30665.1 hypothetical protein CFI11_05470 [Thalassococcus sp. S3]